MPSVLLQPNYLFIYPSMTYELKSNTNDLVETYKEG